MKESWRNVLGFLATGLLAILSAPALAQLSITGNGPYYATPSWDQKLSTNRFVILANWNGEAVLDRETGLVWEKVPSTSASSNWFDASYHCLILNTGGRTGWRLPAVPELMSLVDRSQVGPSLPSGHPFTVQSSNYWSATTFALGGPDISWFVGFANGTVGFASKSISNLVYVWCVRGGSGADTQ